MSLIGPDVGWVVKFAEYLENAYGILRETL